MKNTLFILDGYGQIYRSYYAFASNPLRDRDGNNISAVFGFFNTLMSLLKQYKPEYVAVALDGKEKTFRHSLFAQYKANRQKTPEDLHTQIPVITEILKKIGIKSYEIPKMEADDIIASLCTNAEKSQIQSVMITGDKDLLQLVNENTVALRPPRKGETEWYFCNCEKVKQLFGVEPFQIVDYLTILGDSSDNIAGINGIGEKGAVSLLSEWKTLDNAYANLEKIKPQLRVKLENAKETIPLSKELIELKKNLFDSDVQNFETMKTENIKWEEAVNEFALLGSSRLMKVASQMTNSKKIQKNATLQFLHEIKPEIKTESEKTESANIETANIKTGDFPYLCTYNIKEDKEALKAYENGIKVFDVLLSSWLLDSNAGHYELEELFLKYFKKPLFDSATESQTKDREELIKVLAPVLLAKLKERNLEKIFFEMEMPLAVVLHKMEKQGIRLDSSSLKNFGENLKDLMTEVEKNVYELCGKEFNINSPKQLQEILFIDRELPVIKKTQTGFSTDSDVLEELTKVNEDPVPFLILRYRMLSKLHNTYIDPLISQTDSFGRIHTTFLQTGTATGRLSSKNPNLQNIPVRTEEGRQIRKSFVAENGFKLLSADYSQIELAVLAHFSQDEQLCSAFVNGKDVHKETAALIFSVLPDLVTPQQRRIAKTINFGIIYGMSSFRLAKDLGISRKQAQNFIDTYFEKYNKISSFIEETVNQARKDGYIRTLMGHIRRIDEINSSNKNVRLGAERMAVNSVIQGTAAEIMKLAMLSVDRKLTESEQSSRILLQVHDELILEVPQDRLESVTNLVRLGMENAVSLSIPLRVNIKTSFAWG